MRIMAVTTTPPRTSTIARGDLFPILLFSLTGLLLTALMCIAVPDWATALSDAWTRI